MVGHATPVQDYTNPPHEDTLVLSLSAHCGQMLSCVGFVAVVPVPVLEEPRVLLV
jgi:hypothetical protein